MKNLITLALVLLVLNANGQEPPVEPTRAERIAAMREQVRAMEAAQAEYARSLSQLEAAWRHQRTVAANARTSPFVSVQRTEAAREAHLRQAYEMEAGRHSERAQIIRRAKRQIADLQKQP
jgi:hypothetical protein